MKMTDNNLMLTFQNNCESINSNGVEASQDKKIENIRDEPQDDQLKLPKEQSLVEFEQNLNKESEAEKSKLVQRAAKRSRKMHLNSYMSCYIAKRLKKRSIRCLNKLQIMDDVREGCNIQPSSPGHADQRTEENEETSPENGYTDEKPRNDDAKEPDKTKPDDETDDDVQIKTEPTEESDKKLQNEIQENFLVRNKLFNEIMEQDCNSIEQIHTQTDQILAEIRTLNELAREKEREWNNIIHLKKLKEELLIRMQRRKQILSLNDASEVGDEHSSVNRSILKSNVKQNQRRPSSGSFNGAIDYRARQRPLLDVQSIIADYRQRHPEVVPRRGRRIRHSNALNYSGEFGIPNVPMNLEGLTQSQETSYKDVLVQFAKLSQSEKNELQSEIKPPPPPYPEVTVHPVPTTTVPPTNSLLHGILTKSPTNCSKTSFSPTLARLLTAPERGNATQTNPKIVQQANMSISEILSTSKARNEITITPVASQFELPTKQEVVETEDSVDRLVIDESNEAIDARKGDTSSDAGDDIPMCQGCNMKPSQFVCAGCGNQWYCSRDCQVSAWDDHSEVCSG